MNEERTFDCLRCQHQFQASYDPKVVAERSCPRCGSNSVRPSPQKPLPRSGSHPSPPAHPDRPALSRSEAGQKGAADA